MNNPEGLWKPATPSSNSSMTNECPYCTRRCTVRASESLYVFRCPDGCFTRYATPESVNATGTAWSDVNKARGVYSRTPTAKKRRKHKRAQHGV